jgi:hypothetical protein
VAALGLLAATERTHNAELLTGYFRRNQGYVTIDANPFTVGSDVLERFVRVAKVFPGGPGWLPALCIVLAIVGLVLMARRTGGRAVAARFMLAMIVLAFGGAIIGRVPFGPGSAAFRASLWLAPVVAFGLAAVLEGLRRALASRGPVARRVFDVAALALAIVLVVSAVGVSRPYPNGARAATKQVMATIGPDDAVLITRPGMYSFALYADTPVRMRPMANKIQGFLPAFDDPRLHPVDFLDQLQRRELDVALRSVDRVFVVDSNNDRTGLKDYRFSLAVDLVMHGFEQESTTLVERASVAVWVRSTDPAGRTHASATAP